MRIGTTPCIRVIQVVEPGRMFLTHPKLGAVHFGVKFGVERYDLQAPGVGHIFIQGVISLPAGLSCVHLPQLIGPGQGIAEPVADAGLRRKAHAVGFHRLRIGFLAKRAIAQGRHQRQLVQVEVAERFARGQERTQRPQGAHLQHMVPVRQQRDTANPGRPGSKSQLRHGGRGTAHQRMHLVPRRKEPGRQGRKMGPVLHQFAHFDLAERIGLALGGVGPGAVAVRVDKAGLLGTHLQFSDGERVMWSIPQVLIKLISSLVTPIKLEQHRPAIVPIDLPSPCFVQNAKVDNLLRIADFIGQTGIGPAIPPLIHQLKTGRVGTSRAGMDTFAEERLFPLLHRPRDHGVTALFSVQPG
ncbi:hypothetical protein CSB97_2711 [Pseudomonas aeruginosa]|nr:hypothetical protein CSB97_2711 [Pseudomonas aeruginosa]